MRKCDENRHVYYNIQTDKYCQCGERKNLFYFECTEKHFIPHPKDSKYCVCGEIENPSYRYRYKVGEVVHLKGMNWVVERVDDGILVMGNMDNRWVKMDLDVEMVDLVKGDNGEWGEIT